MFDYSILQVIWWVLVIVLLSGFVIFDGFDIGALALNPFVSKTEAERRVVINTIAPHWDGNQVWLLLGGGAIFAAWPEVYATSFSGFYLAMILILAALYFRPVGLEYRSKFEDEKHRRMVDWGLWFSGFVPALIIGVALGNVLQGVPFHIDEIGRSHWGTGEFFIINLLRLLDPFSLLCGVLGFCVFLLQGANWIMLRVEKNTDIYARTKKIAKALYAVLFLMIVVVTVWLFFIDGYKLSENAGDLILATQAADVVREGTWFNNYFANPVLFVVPLLFIGAYAFSFKAYSADKNAVAFIASSVGVLLAFTTFAISLFPFVLPSSLNPHQSLTVWNATSSQYTLQVMFWVAIVFTPIVLAYTAWCYYKLWQRLSPSIVESNSHSLY